ncbi:methyltransferase type 11 [Mucilaginibacter sp.]|uniref:methyltransferase type 11 n=1 Tax=Mucilaginibacter sp. TaxID=1882438 RepID=UPI00262A3FF0|nr:methyltransferase type 11 [Mucilaginibacter sp.]MDB4920688.1 methyltransferase type 11 [Mucilaginibacter sp.]
MKQVEIFKTDVHNEGEASLVIFLLDEYYPDFKVNFDMDDDDKILRVESTEKQISGSEIESLLEGIGVCCKIFKD